MPLKRIKNFFSGSGLFLSVFCVTAGGAMACPSELPPNPFRTEIKIPSELPPNPFRSVMTGFGLTASDDTQEGDSCGIAPHTPSGMVVTDVSVLNAETGESVGFIGFKPDPTITSLLCDERRWLHRNNQTCTGFISEVGPGGLPAGTPLKIVFEIRFGTKTYKVSGKSPYVVPIHRARIDIVKMANAFARTGTVITTGLDSFGNPERHLSVHSPQKVTVCLGPVDPITGLTTCEENDLPAPQ